MALDSIADLELYRKNPFRVTGLPVDASPKEIGKLTDRLKMFAELGNAWEHQQFAFSLDQTPPIEEIREAAQTLRDPEKKITYGFFWFWPE